MANALAHNRKVRQELQMKNIAVSQAMFWHVRWDIVIETAAVIWLFLLLT